MLESFRTASSAAPGRLVSEKSALDMWPSCVQRNIRAGRRARRRVVPVVVVGVVVVAVVPVVVVVVAVVAVAL